MPQSTDYYNHILFKQLIALSADERNHISILCNASALLNEYLDDINWVGFYLLQDDTLILGPFQGKPACIRIEIGKGVCGTSLLKQQTERVGDVHTFPGHIACDSASCSEIVIPIMIHDKPYGVLDIDSPSYHRFDCSDQALLETFVHTLEQFLL